MRNITVSDKAIAEMHEKPKMILHISLQEIFNGGFIWSMVMNSDFFFTFFFFCPFFLFLNGTFHGYAKKPLETVFSL